MAFRHLPWWVRALVWLTAILTLLVIVLPSFAEVHPTDLHPVRESILGELFLADLDGTGGVDITVTTGGTYYGWTSAVLGHAGGMGSDVANATADQLIVRKTGDYRISLHGCFSGTPNATVTCKTFISGTANNHIAFVRKLGASGDVGSASMAGIDSLVVGDTVDVRCTTIANTKTINFWAVNLSVSMVRE